MLLHPTTSRPTTPERFWAKVDRLGPDDCWNWIATTSSNGYGRFRVNGSYVQAHRWAYENQVGPIPAGLQIDHLCRTRSCINPKHMEPVTPQVNTLRGIRSRVRKTHCKRGHEFTENNTYNRPDRPGRRCLKCHRRAGRRYYLLTLNGKDRETS